jgi:hypothetical protein
MIISNLSDENIKFYINKEIMVNCTISGAFKNNDIYKYSCDYLNIRDDRKKGSWKTNFILKHLKNVITEYNNKYIEENINENVICFISSFTTGTVHGYASIWEYIIYYLKNKLNSKIILSTITQSGIKQIVTHIFKKENIILLKPNIIYNIKHITFIPITQFHFSDMFWKDTEKYFTKYIINQKFNTNIKKIALFKTTNTDNCSKTGIMDSKTVDLFCKKNNIYKLIPAQHNEINTANLIHNCEIFICCWGTAYYKNIRYIGNKCKFIYVFIQKHFIGQYNLRKNTHHSHIYKKYKNAIVEYIIIDDITSLQFRI